MGRKRAELGPGADDRIVAMMARGLGPDAIATELGTSRATAARRMKELRDGVPKIRAARRANAARGASHPTPTDPLPMPSASPGVTIVPPFDPGAARATARAALPDADVEIPESTPLEQINEWLKMASEEVKIARTGDDLDTIQKMTRLAATLLTLQQKYTPAATPDPNEHPDFVAAAARARKRMHELIDKAAGISPAHALAGMIEMGDAIRARYRR